MKKYNQYKDSGVEWIGEIPVHWRVKRFRYLFDLGKGLTITKANLTDKGILCVNYGEVHSKYGFEVDVNEHLLKCVNEEYLTSNPNSMIHKGDFVFADTSEDIDGSGNFTYLKSELPIFAGYHTVIARPKGNLNSRFIAYCFDSESFRNQIRTKVKGIKVYSITQAILKRCYLWLPDIKEQQKIVTYLDRKTQQIDQFLQLKEQKIALLQEKRTALINEVVTKGLNPDVAFKDSGVEWIGEIPAHWEMKRVKYLFEIRKRIAGELGYDVLSITQNGIKVKDIVTGKGQLSMDYRKYQIVEPMDFAMNHMDLLTGFVDISKHLGVTSPDYRVFSLVDKQSSHDYYLFLLQFGYINKVFYGFGQGSSMFGRWRLPAKEFLDFHFPYPPLEEQKAIVKYLYEQFDEIDQTIEFEQQKIALLKEYRQSLISEVVTGKIRVYEEDLSAPIEAPKL